jgi:hypothetical protein
MSQINAQASMPHGKQDALTPATDLLQQILAATASGREEDWSETLWEALVVVEQALRQHRKSAAAPDGVFADVDDTRPTLAHQADELCGEHSDLLSQARTLRKGLQRVADSSEEECAGEVADFTWIRLGAEELLAGLRQIEEAETDLIQESVNTDIGVGD